MTAARKLARAIHFDESDTRIYAPPARTGEWCISGGFAFSNWTEADLTGKARQAFANGWLGLETFGRVTFVAVTRIEAREYDALTGQLAQHFVEAYGAPDLSAALPVAEQEMAQMAELCAGQPANTLLTVARSLSAEGIRETFRVIAAPEAELAQVAVHSTPES